MSVRTFLVQALIAPIRLYRVAVSPLRGPVCRYHPTCSAYAIEALARHGPVSGLALALRRLLRCHPWGGCGHDPVPPASSPVFRHLLARQLFSK